MTSLSPQSRRGLLLISARRVLRISEDEPADAVVFCETVLSAAFVFICGVAIWLVLNAGTLLFGIYVTPVWRPAARFHILFLPGRIPIVVIAMPVLIAFAFWRSMRAYGPMITAAPVLITVALGVALLSGVMILNRYRRNLKPWPLSDS
jgi:hypothetical protein